MVKTVQPTQGKNAVLQKPILSNVKYSSPPTKSAYIFFPLPIRTLPLPYMTAALSAAHRCLANIWTLVTLFELVISKVLDSTGIRVSTVKQIHFCMNKNPVNSVKRPLLFLNDNSQLKQKLIVQHFAKVS